MSEHFAENQALAIRRLRRDKWRCHEVFFPHRHMRDGEPVEPAPFHPEIVADFWSSDPYSQVLAFRGSAKSTLAEEDIVLAVCFRAYRNILIVGSSEGRAAERLAAVSYELLNNPLLVGMFGDQRGSVWTQTKLVMAWGGCVQAMGRDQDIRGIKHLDWRPDFVLVDDFEDRDNVQTPEGRNKTLRWFLGELLPACSPSRKVRVRATPMDAESVPMRLADSGWPTRIFPVEHFSAAGKSPSWPAAFPADWIDRERRLYERLGQLAVWEREFMCEARAASEQTFRAEDIRVVPRERTWQACYAMIDPARTVSRTSATTGWAVWSWVRRRLVVWAAGGDLLLPDEIVALCFEIADRFAPLWIGFEKTGLSEWAMQPIRQEAVKRGVFLPVKALDAPKGKLDFIRGLQPLFANGEAEFAQDLPALREQMLNFPRSRIDAPNALAYAQQMRPGLPIYDGFDPGDHIEETPAYLRDRPLFLAADATGTMMAAALVQVNDGRLVVLADWVLEDLPAIAVDTIQADAMLTADSLRAGQPIRPRSWENALKAVAPLATTRKVSPCWIVPRKHGQQYGNVGLMQAIRHLPAEVRFGGDATQGGMWLADQLQKTIRQTPCVSVAATAHWTIRAFMGGYCKAMHRGQLQQEAEEGPYSLLMQGLEAFCGMIRVQRDEDDGDAQPMAYDRMGRAYRSAMPERRR